MLVSFKTRKGILKNLSMFRLNFDKFESIINLKMVNVFQDKTKNREPFGKLPFFGNLAKN